MTLIEVEELCRYWADHPPVHVLAAALLGHKRGLPPSVAPAAAAVAAELGQGIAVGDVNAGLPPPVLAFELLRADAARPG